MTSLAVQWLGVPLPVRGTRVRLLVHGDPQAKEQLGPCATATEPELEAHTLHSRSPCFLEPVLRNKEASHRCH